jgi:hypothetical protein
MYELISCRSAELGALKNAVEHDENEAEERAYSDALASALDAGEDQVQEQKQHELWLSSLKERAQRQREEAQQKRRSESVHQDGIVTRSAPDVGDHSSEENEDDDDDQESLISWRFSKRRS